MKAGVGGEVTLRFTVAVDGSTSGVTVEKSTNYGFEDVSKAAVAKWTFFPASMRRGGEKVTAHMRCRFEFRATEE